VGARGLQVSSQEAGERVASFQKGRFKAEAETFTLRRVHEEMTDHYQTLGLHRRCTEAQIRTAYRMLAKQHHPDVNGGSEESVLRTRMLNAAHEVLSDPEARAAYDRELAAAERASVRVRAGRIEKNVAQDITLRLEDFLKGTRLEIRVNDPANPDGPETYTCEVPAGTAPGARFRVPREGAFRGGHVLVRVKAGADFQFKARGSDLRCDLRISADRAAKGGSELLRGLGGGSVRVEIPKGVGRGEIVRVTGEGLPRPRGGRGDLLVRIQYRPEVTVRRAGK
jgi:DnaJ-class molecular chaperone